MTALTGRIAGTAAGLCVASAVMVQAQDGGRGYYGHMGGDGYGMEHGVFGGFVMVLFWVVLIALVVIAVRWLMDQGGGKKTSALSILQERLAKGEIDAEEYATRKKALES